MWSTDELEGRARAAGFAVAGAAAAIPGGEGAALDRFLAAGCHAGMGWLARSRDWRGDPRQVLDGARTVVVLGAAHPPPADGPPTPGDRPSGALAAFARRDDYHDVLLTGARALADALPDAAARPYVDTGAVMEKVWAVRAGLGWQGRQTQLVSRRHGCWLLLAAVVTRAELSPSEEPHRDLCGTCTRCVDACPTSALTVVDGQPRIDARRCRGYWTVEARGMLPVDVRAQLGDALFGCDDCLGCCPWNRFAGEDIHPGLASRLPARLPLDDVLALDAAAFRARFAGTPIGAVRRRTLLRNAAVAAGNAGDRGAVPALAAALDGDVDVVVRAHAAWALGRLGGASARRALERHRGADEPVGGEVERALAGT